MMPPACWGIANPSGRPVILAAHAVSVAARVDPQQDTPAGPDGSPGTRPRSDPGVACNSEGEAS